MNPDAIIIFSAGIMPLDNGAWRPTTYKESDGFGTMGGQDRVEAGFLLSKKYPNAFIVTTCQRMDKVLPTLAETYAKELEKLGVKDSRIIKEEISINTGASVEEVFKIAEKREWKNLIFVSSEFQIPRIKAFYEQIKRDVKVTFISSESILTEKDPEFANKFAEIKKSKEYIKRLKAEENGILAIKAGKYRPANIKDKKERVI